MPNARKYQVQNPMRGKRRLHPKCLASIGEQGFPHDLPHFAPFTDQEGNEWQCYCTTRIWPGMFICPYGDIQLPIQMGVQLVQNPDRTYRERTPEDPPESVVLFSKLGAERALAGEF